jgi:hypothetical protein
LSDIYAILTTDLSANGRFRLMERQLNGLPYWSFKR